MNDQGNILIIHPEGNINNNPNLSGIVEILCEHGYRVDIVSPKRVFSQVAQCDGARIFLYDDRITRQFAKLSIFNQFSLLINNYHIYKKVQVNYKLIIGVDRDGIIGAAYLSQLLKLPCGLISYEIFFGEETGKRFKIDEINACKNIEFAVCQDELRSSFLSEENQIPLDKIIHIPVAGRGEKRGEKSLYLHNVLSIPYDKKIALFMGSIAEWTMIRELIQSVEDWPDEWVLVLHHRYGRNSEIHKILPMLISDKIYVSNESYTTTNDLSKMLHSVDLGVAFYKPTYDSIYTGKNLKYLGLSSGKISTYLQHGIPVLTNEIGLLSDYISSYNSGFVVQNVNEIKFCLQYYHKYEYLHNNSIKLFKKTLDLDLHIDLLINKIMAL